MKIKMKELDKLVENIILEAKKKKNKSTKKKVEKDDDKKQVQPHEYMQDDALDFSKPLGSKSVTKTAGAVNWGGFTSDGINPPFDLDESSVWHKFLPSKNIWENALASSAAVEESPFDDMMDKDGRFISTPTKYKTLNLPGSRQSQQQQMQGQGLSANDIFDKDGKFITAPTQNKTLNIPNQQWTNAMSPTAQQQRSSAALPPPIPGATQRMPGSSSPPPIPGKQQWQDPRDPRNRR